MVVGLATHLARRIILLYHRACAVYRFTFCIPFLPLLASQSAVLVDFPLINWTRDCSSTQYMGHSVMYPGFRWTP